MGLKWQFHFISHALASSKTNLKEDLTQEHSEVRTKNNLHSTTQKIMWYSYDETQKHIWPSSTWTQEQYYNEHNNMLKYSQEHNNILKYFSLPRFSSKSRWVPWHVAQDYWSHSNGYKRSRNSINRSGRLDISYTFAKHTRKQLKSVWIFSKNIDLTKIPRSL